MIHFKRNFLILIIKDQYQGILPQDLIDACKRKGLVFDHKYQSGPVFHLLGALSEFGKVGVTCIADSAEEAEALYHKVEGVLDGLGSYHTEDSAHKLRRSDSGLIIPRVTVVWDLKSLR